MDELQTVGTWVASSLAGGGVVAVAGYAVLKNKLVQDLLKIFAKRSELKQAKTEIQSDINAVGSKVTGAISMASMAKDTADDNADGIIRLQESEKHRWEPVLKHMEQANKRADQHEILLTKLTTTVDEIVRRLERSEDRRDGR